MYRNLILCFLYAIANLTHASVGDDNSGVCPHWGCGAPTLWREARSRPQFAEAPRLPNHPAAPAPQARVGEIQQFFTHIPDQQVEATCLAIGENIYLYIETAFQHMMTAAQAREIVAEFDARIYPQVHRWIGYEWRPGLDLDTRITLLMHDVGANNSGKDFGGYFTSVDLDPAARNSNRREMVYMDVFQFKERSRFTFYNSLAHEFAHLVNWYQNGGMSDERWIEEGIASFVEWAIYRNVHGIFIDGYLKDPGISLTSANTFETYYGASFTLLLYLFERHGGERFIREFARQDLLGTRGIDATLTLLGRQERFADVFQNWALANFVNNLARGSSLGYKNLPNRRVAASARQVSSYPTIGAAKVEEWGARYIVFRNLPDQIEIALDGSGDGNLHARLALLPSNGAASVHAFTFDEDNNGQITLNDLNSRDRIVLMATSDVAQSFRYAATRDGASDIVIGPPRQIAPSVPLPDATTHASGSRSQPSHKRGNVDFKLEPISQVHLSSDYQDVVVDEGLVYAASDWGLEIFDLEMPSHPQLIGEIATPGNAQGITVDGETAYIADGAAGVTLINVRRPDNPTLIKTIGDFERVRRIKIDGDTVYLSDDSQGFQILDFGLINVPAFAGILDMLALDFDIVDGYAYVASGDLGIVDVRDRLKPTAISSVQTSGFTTGVKYRDGYAYLTGLQSGLHVMDVRNPLQPRSVAMQPTLGNAVSLDVFRSDANQTFGYIADGNHGLQAIDLTIPNRPQWLHRYDASGEAHGMHILRTEEGHPTAYIASGVGGIKIVEIDGAYDAVFRHRIPTEGPAMDLRVENDHAYIAAGESGLIVMELGNIDNPRTVSRIGAAAPALGVEISDGYVFLCADELIVVDSREPMRSRVVARRSMPGSAYRITIVGTLGYVAALNGGLRIFDLDDPANPRAIGSYDTPGNATNIAVFENRGYLLDTQAGVQILDLTNPRRPELIAEYQTDALPIAARIRGDYLFLLDQERVQILDVRNQSLVSRPNFQAALRFPSDLAVVGETVYVADRHDLRMFKINERLFELSVEDPGVFRKPPNEAKTARLLYTNRLGQNFPNPFNPETWIPYEIESDASVAITIFDTRGASVRRLDMGHQKAGEYVTRAKAAYWDGRNETGEPVGSGLYFYRISAGEFVATRRMAILK